MNMKKSEHTQGQPVKYDEMGICAMEIMSLAIHAEEDATSALRFEQVELLLNKFDKGLISEDTVKRIIRRII